MAAEVEAVLRLQAHRGDGMVGSAAHGVEHLEFEVAVEVGALRLEVEFRQFLLFGVHCRSLSGCGRQPIT